MSKKSIFHIFCILQMLSVLVFMESCKPSVPNEYIQPNEMEDILYDYHIADAIAIDGNKHEDIYSYWTSILNKYGVTQKQYDSSMLYYTRHTEKLHSIYKSLSNRLGKEALAQGASVNDINNYGNITSSGDTTNIWTNSKSMLFIPYKMCNLSSFVIKADTSFHKGDRIVLSFDTQFLYQDGVRDGVVALALKLGNDSVVTQITHMSSSNHYSLQIADNTSLGIKEVKGYILLSSDQNSDMRSETTLKMMLISNIQLIRMHENKVVQKEKKDTLEVKHLPIKDSLPTPSRDQLMAPNRPNGNNLRKFNGRKI